MRVDIESTAKAAKLWTHCKKKISLNSSRCWNQSLELDLNNKEAEKNSQWNLNSKKILTFLPVKLRLKWVENLSAKRMRSERNSQKLLPAIREVVVIHFSKAENYSFPRSSRYGRARLGVICHSKKRESEGKTISAIWKTRFWMFFFFDETLLFFHSWFSSFPTTRRSLRYCAVLTCRCHRLSPVSLIYWNSISYMNGSSSREGLLNPQNLAVFTELDSGDYRRCRKILWVFFLAFSLPLLFIISAAFLPLHHSDAQK